MAEKVESDCWKSSLALHFENEEEDDGTPPAGFLMRKLFEKQLYTDVDFFSPPNPKELISAHRAVLAAQCEFFEQLLFGSQRNEAAGMNMQVGINNVPFGVFKGIVKYFYTGDIDLTDEATVLDILATAHSFKIQPLIETCEQYLEELALNEDNACSLLQLACAKGADALKTRCIDYVKTNTLQVISSPDFEKSSYSTVREICDLPDLGVRSESEVLEAVLRWVRLQPQHARADLRDSLLRRVRFLSFGAAEFRDLLQKHPDLLAPGDALDILMCLNEPTLKNRGDLPQWIHRGQRTFARGVPRTSWNAPRKIEIPLSGSGECQPTELTCVLQMRCVAGSHRVNALRIVVDKEADDEEESAFLTFQALVLPKRHVVSLSQTIHSRETVLQLQRGIFVAAGQVLHLRMTMKTFRPTCRFLKLDAESRKDPSNEHFQCSVASKPKAGRHFFVAEVEYGAHRPGRERLPAEHRQRHRGVSRKRK